MNAKDIVLNEIAVSYQYILLINHTILCFYFGANWYAGQSPGVITISNHYYCHAI